ncbi:CBS domain-containing protein [Anaerobranca gottschalkii]|uniref:PAS domain S-box-containing protein n=1 Tax=Anaerobranca gottschalkii DSM 13577 TaxID=1120990 RepID=A0A1H9Y4E9_9FIRM|nr:CBS domain-containing protein [Anaerobranca gottschalkii]SES63559.1 PAS domain S-box-containing protein [Anaerobranca gottschalkii DSM 13577]
MLVKDIFKKTFLMVSPDQYFLDVIREMSNSKESCAFVVTEGQQLVGMVTHTVLQDVVIKEGNLRVEVKEVMIPIEKVHYVYPDTDLQNSMKTFVKYGISYMPVLESPYNKKIIGVLSHKDVIKNYMKEQVKIQLENFKEKRARQIIESLNEGLIVVDRDLIIREFNPAAEKLTGLRAVDRIGKKAVNLSKQPSITELVISTGEPRYGVETKLQDGRVFLVNYVPLKRNGSDFVEGVVQTFSDITNFKSLQTQLSKTKEELDKAFALTLPNSKVEYKLKTTPEYRDVYDPETSTITITEIIEGGGYLHVVNCLKVAADFNEMGLMKLIGIDKDTLVEAIIFHDLGKSQPTLKIGDKVSPEEVFEEGIYHAARSADLASKFYGKSDDIVNIIRYHHHSEDMLPKEFPSHLLPLLRMFKIIDGLSAALTRRNAKVTYKVEGSKLTVFEENQHPLYNRILEVDLYTGKRQEKPMGRMEKNEIN